MDVYDRCTRVLRLLLRLTHERKIFKKLCQVKRISTFIRNTTHQCHFQNRRLTFLDTKCIPNDALYALIHYVLSHVVYEFYKVILSLIIRV